MAGLCDHRAVGDVEILQHQRYGFCQVKRNAGWFIAGGVVTNVLPTLLALWLHERNVRSNATSGLGLWLEKATSWE